MTDPHPLHIVGLNGSPHRNGNTTTLIRWILEGAAHLAGEGDNLKTRGANPVLTYSRMLCLQQE